MLGASPKFVPCWERPLSSRWPKESKKWHPSVSLGKINGGTSWNAIPVSCTAELDFRGTEEKPIEEWEKTLIATVEEYGLMYKNLLIGSLCHTDKNNPYMRILQKIISERTHATPVFIKEHGGCDGRHFSGQGIPVIITSPIGGDHHADREWVDLDSLSAFYDVTCQFIEQTAVVSQD